MKSEASRALRLNAFDKRNFDEDYFERGEASGKSLYTNYRWLPELTIPMCADIIYQLDIGYEARILDYGCAKGFAVHAFRLLHREAYGVDVSNYAIDQAPQEVKPYVSKIELGQTLPLIENEKYDWLISKDVLEHVPYDQLAATLKLLRAACKKAFFVLPLGDGDKFFAPPHELDSTHFIREDIPWWSEQFAKAGFSVLQAEYNLGYIKTNFSQWKYSTGFFVVE